MQYIGKEKSSSLSVEQQVLKLSSNSPEIKADTSSEMLLQWAWTRRGLAFDQSQLISWETHQLWVQQLLGFAEQDCTAWIFVDFDGPTHFG